MPKSNIIILKKKKLKIFDRLFNALILRKFRFRLQSIQALHYLQLKAESSTSNTATPPSKKSYRYIYNKSLLHILNQGTNHLNNFFNIIETVQIVQKNSQQHNDPKNEFHFVASPHLKAFFATNHNSAHKKCYVSSLTKRMNHSSISLTHTRNQNRINPRRTIYHRPLIEQPLSLSKAEEKSNQLRSATRIAHDPFAFLQHLEYHQKRFINHNSPKNTYPKSIFAQKITSNRSSQATPTSHYLNSNRVTHHPAFNHHTAFHNWSLQYHTQTNNSHLNPIWHHPKTNSKKNYFIQKRLTSSTRLTRATSNHSSRSIHLHPDSAIDSSTQIYVQNSVYPQARFNHSQNQLDFRNSAQTSKNVSFFRHGQPSRKILASPHRNFRSIATPTTHRSLYLRLSQNASERRFQRISNRSKNKTTHSQQKDQKSSLTVLKTYSSQLFSIPIQNQIHPQSTSTQGRIEVRSNHLERMTIRYPHILKHIKQSQSQPPGLTHRTHFPNQQSQPETVIIHHKELAQETAHLHSTNASEPPNPHPIEHSSTARTDSQLNDLKSSIQQITSTSEQIFESIPQNSSHKLTKRQMNQFADILIDRLSRHLKIEKERKGIF